MVSVLCSACGSVLICATTGLRWRLRRAEMPRVRMRDQFPIVIHDINRAPADAGVAQPLKDRSERHNNGKHSVKLVVVHQRNRDDEGRMLFGETVNGSLRNLHKIVADDCCVA